MNCGCGGGGGWAIGNDAGNGNGWQHCGCWLRFLFCPQQLPIFFS